MLGWSDAEKALAQIKSGGKVGELTKTERREQKKREPYTPPSGNSKKNKPTKQPQKKEDDKIMNKISKVCIFKSNLNCALFA